MTLSNLRQGNPQPDYSADIKAEEKPAGTAAKMFTDDALSIQWTLMCNRMQQHLVGLAARLKNLTPHISNYPDIEVVLDNEILLSQTNDIKGNIVATMRKTLGNNDIRLTLTLADPDKTRMVFTKREIFDNLRQQNPAIEKLRLKLGLELA